MGGEGVDHAKRQLPFPPVAERLGAEGLEVMHAGGVEPVGKREGVAVEAEHQGGAHVGGGATQAELDRPEHGRQGVGGVDFPKDELVPQRGPAHLALEVHGQPVMGEEPQFPGGDQRGGIRERHKPQPEPAGRGGGRVDLGGHGLAG